MPEDSVVQSGAVSFSRAPHARNKTLIVQNSMESSIFENNNNIDVLESEFDFFAGLESHSSRSLAPISKRKDTEEDIISLESDDSVIQKLIKLNKKKGHNPKKMPGYLRNQLPDKKFRPAKELASSLPEQCERPPPEMFDEPLSLLFKKEQIKI